MRKICFLSNYPSHYRLPIYSKMADNFDIDFYFGDLGSSPLCVKIKDFKKSDLKNYTKQFKAIKIFRSFTWYKGCHILLKKKYNEYILIGETNSFSVWIILIYAKIFNKSTSLWMHGIKSKNVSKKGKLLFNLFIKLSTRQFIYGDYAIKNMKNLGFNTSKMYPIHNSLNTEYQSLIYSKLKETTIFEDHFGNKNPVVIFSGRVQKIKRIDLLLDAISLLLKDGIKCNLILIGGVDPTLNINKLIEDLNLEKNVWLYGPEYNEEKLADFFYNSSVCVSPGNVGLTSIHSMSFGTPVISNDNFEEQMPEFEAIIPQKTGSFFKQNDIVDLSVKISFWLQIKDRNLVRKNCRYEVLKNWSLKYQINLFDKTINTIIE